MNTSHRHPDRLAHLGSVRVIGLDVVVTGGCELGHLDRALTCQGGVQCGHDQTQVLIGHRPIGARQSATDGVRRREQKVDEVTPRLETRRIVEGAKAGVATATDGVDDLAAAITMLLGSESLRAELGANARRAAVERYDWRVLSMALADAILGR